ncbi:MAG: adenylate/guanylate cyclase domain-containing protein [Fimbriimonadaceae bacterium]|nr:adenylate/guanylate cyclase domain-containing protein [Fimbriimonadaceae bacterium]
MARSIVAHCIAGAFFVALAVWLADYIVGEQEWANGLDLKNYFWLVSRMRVPDTEPEVVLIEIRPQTNQSLNLGPGKPSVPRKYWADLISKLDKAGARVVAFDISFIDERPGDPELIQAIENAEHVITVLTKWEQYPGDELAEVAYDETQPDGLEHRYHPNPIFEQSETDRVRVGVLGALETDYGIGSIATEYTDTNTLEPISHFGLVAALAGRGIAPDQCEFAYDMSSVTCANLTWELQGNFDIAVLFPKSMEKYVRIPLEDALLRLEKGTFPEVKDKIILVGDLREEGDIGRIPGAGNRPGPHMNANIIDSLLMPPRYQVKTLPLNFERGATFILCALALAGAWFLKPRAYIPVFAVLFVLIFVAAQVAASNQGVVFSTVFPSLALLTCGVGLGIFTTVRGWPQPHHRQESHLICVLFVDLRGSTPLLLKIGKERFQDLKKQVHEIGLRTISTNKGVLERSTGDGFMATFHLKSADDSVFAALKTAKEFTAGVESLGPEYGEELRVGCGIECGQVSGTYLKEDDRYAWSSTGATINLAERLQGLSGRLGESILLGPTAAGLLTERAETESVGEHELKGFETPVVAYRPKQDDLRNRPSGRPPAR